MLVHVLDNADDTRLRNLGQRVRRCEAPNGKHFRRELELFLFAGHG